MTNFKQFRPNFIPPVFRGMNIRPKAKKTRLYLDNEYFEGGYAASFKRFKCTPVYLILAKFANHSTQICYPRTETIMRLTGITNRNQIFDAEKILQAYNIISVTNLVGIGTRVNFYALINSADWEPVNSIPLDTILNSESEPIIVSKSATQPYQNESENGSTLDTGSNITGKSSKEKSSKEKILLEIVKPEPRAEPVNPRALLNQQTNQIMEVFKSFNPALEVGEPAERQAVRRMIAATGFESVIGLSEYAVAHNAETYCPVITKPSELEKKMGQLGVFKKRQETSNGRKVWKLGEKPAKLPVAPAVTPPIVIKKCDKCQNGWIRTARGMAPCSCNKIPIFNRR